MTNIIIGIVVVVVLTIIMYIKITIDEKKGENSPEKQKIYQIAQQLLPNVQSPVVVYATREDFSLSGSGSMITTTTKYWYYAVAFDVDNLYMIPLFFEDEDISYGEVMHFNKDNLGMTEAKNHGFMTLYDKERKKILDFDVNPSNTKDDKYHPVNIQQKEETKVFIEFSKEFMKIINSSNNIDDIKKAKKEAKTK